MNVDHLFLILFLNCCMFASCSGNRSTQDFCVLSETVDSLDEHGQNIVLTASENSDSIYLAIIQKKVTEQTQKVQVKLYNNSSRYVYTGEHFNVEYYTDDGWKKCPRKFEIVINDIGIRLYPHCSYTFDIPLIHLKLDKKFPHYRILKEIRVDSVERELECRFYLE